MIFIVLAGPEELTDEENDSLPIDVQYLPSDKERESVSDVIVALVQALHKMCSTQMGRDTLRLEKILNFNDIICTFIRKETPNIQQ